MGDLRCQAGDIAVITQDEPECQANIGQLVRVLHPREEPASSGAQGFEWLVEPLSLTPSPVLIGYAPQDRTVVWDSRPRAHFDHWLWPIRDFDSDDGADFAAEWNDVPTIATTSTPKEMTC